MLSGAARLHPSETVMQAGIVVSAAIVSGGRLLLVQEGKEYCRGQWGLPGGRVEKGEPLVEAVIREVYEETGLRVRVTGMTRVLRYVSQYGFHCVRFNFFAEAEGELTSVDGAEILAARWYPFEELDALDDAQLRSPAIARTVFNDILSGAIYPLDIILDALAPSVE